MSAMQYLRNTVTVAIKDEKKMDNKNQPDNKANPKKYRLQAHTYLKRELNMNDDQIITVLGTLSAPLRTTLKSVEEAQKEQDPKAMLETAHSLKGALLNLGLNDLADLVKGMENTPITGEKTIYTKQLAYLSSALSDI